MSETALSTVPHVWVEEGVGWTGSRDVAAYFGKPHRQVLRDINKLEIGTDLCRSWFRPALYQDSYGREQPSVDMTKDGFTILAFGFTGAKALAFKKKYIETFNRMAEAIESGAVAQGIVTFDQLLAAIREFVAPLAVRHDHHDRAISVVADNVDKLSVTVDEMSERVGQIENKLNRGRRRIMPPTKEKHVWAISQMGGKCPGCRVNDVLNSDGTVSRLAEFDHFYASSMPSVDHTWLICRMACHDPLSSNRIPRGAREHAFNAYQEARRNLPRRQPGLFG
jgi:Rha family phage regulatory protein